MSPTRSSKKGAKKSGTRKTGKTASGKGRSPAKKTATKKRTAKTAAKKAVVRRTVARKPGSDEKSRIEPGPPMWSMTPVEEPIHNETAIGTITHYYDHIGVAVIQINSGILKTGDIIHILGHRSDLLQTVASMEYEHQHIDAAAPGQSVGIKVDEHVRVHDIVYLVK